MKKFKGFKFTYFNHSEKLQSLIFQTEEIGFDWLDRYGVEYFGHKEVQCDESEFWDFDLQYHW